MYPLHIQLKHNGTTKTLESLERKGMKEEDRSEEKRTNVYKIHHIFRNNSAFQEIDASFI